MQVDRQTVNEWSKEAHRALTTSKPGYDFTDVLMVVAQRASEAERQAMKPHIIQALKEAETEMENYSYFGSNRGVPKDDYEDVADAAIRARGTTKEKQG